MKLVITIKMDNAAFGDDAFSRAQEVAFILGGVAANVCKEGIRCPRDYVSNSHAITDINGNRVGDVVTIA